MNRRNFILASMGLSTGYAFAGLEGNNVEGSMEIPSFEELAVKNEDKEPQIFDDLADPQPQIFFSTQESIEKSATGPMIADFPRLKDIDFGAKMVDEALNSDRYRGRSRKNNGEAVITEMLWLAQNNSYKYANGKYVPFCAAGIVHLACVTYSKQSKNERLLFVIKSGVEAKKRYEQFDKLLPTIRESYFFPSAAVRYIVAYARDKKKNWMSMDDIRLNKKEIKKGWLIVFRFPAGFHIGIVAEGAISSAKEIKTFEFNTANPEAKKGADERDGGWIGLRTRKLPQSVIGFVDLTR
jgi:hypothetical protein